MFENINEGDEVMLKSDLGGPIMTVDSIHGDDTVCVWRDKNGKPQQAYYRVTSLRKIPKD